MVLRRPIKLIFVTLGCAVVFAIGVLVGFIMRRPTSALRHDLPVEYSYFELQMALATGSPEQTLRLVDRTLEWYNQQQELWTKKDPQAFMQKSVMLAIRSRALVALHRDSEAQAAAQEAGKACVQAGRKYCDGKRIVEFSKRLLRAAWEPSDKSPEKP